MSRIRSVHPGFFRDEDLVACSAFARLLYIGLGVEADDKGIFEWKPVQLRMSIFPADSVDVAELLSELVAAGNIKRFEAGGRAFGAIRNFRKFQRPKTPNNIHPMPDDIAEYVAFPRKAETPDDKPDAFPTNREKSPQMEDEGGRVEDEDTPPPPVPEPEGARVSFEDVLEAYPRDPGPKTSTAKKAFERIPEIDRPTVLAGAIYTSKALAADSAKRGRSVEEGAKWVTELHNFIANGEWRSAAALAAKDQPSPDLAVVEADSPEFKALAKARGRTPYVGDSGRITVPKAELEKAMAAA
jgi:hypothetical protein